MMLSLTTLMGFCLLSSASSLTSFERHMVCEGYTVTDSEYFGTMEIRSFCKITIPDVKGRVIFFHVIQCNEDDGKLLEVNGERFCYDRHSYELKDIDSNAMTIEAAGADKVDPFEIEYFRGKSSACIVLHRKD